MCVGACQNVLYGIGYICPSLAAHSLQLSLSLPLFLIVTSSGPAAICHVNFSLCFAFVILVVGSDCCCNCCCCFWCLVLMCVCDIFVCYLVPLPEPREITLAWNHREFCVARFKAAPFAFAVSSTCLSFYLSLSLSFCLSLSLTTFLFLLFLNLFALTTLHDSLTQRFADRNKSKSSNSSC